MIPTSSNYPQSFDDDTNLYLTHDSLRVQLSEDYTPGDSSVAVQGDAAAMAKFPDSGLITLTEQCSDIDDRAISFFYSSKTATTFNGLELLPNFTDVSKRRFITNITQNVMAAHHNNIKDAIIAIQEFVGIKGTVDSTPLGNTIVGRINFLKKLILTPRAWFTVNKTVGLIPLTVTFEDQSFRLGSNPKTFIWDFGDQSCLSAVSCTMSACSIISPGANISVTSVVPPDQVGVIVEDLDGGTVTKTYTCPGIYDVKLTVSNGCGEDVVQFKQLINARVEAPQEAVIDFIPTVSQLATAGDDAPSFDRLATNPGGPFAIPPTIRSKTNAIINIEVPEGNHSSTRSNGGEKLNGSGSPIDPITEYTWSLGDDLTHSSLSSTKASYSIGGVYDLKLRVDTQYNSYRITTYENSIDIIEDRSLWLFTFTNSTDVIGHEFGLISETFKTATQTKTVSRSSAFLTGTGEEERAKKEFNKNTSFAPRTTTNSGNKGTALMFWASGGSPLADQTIKIVEYEGFSDTFFPEPSLTITRPWNWAALNSGEKTYFLFGPEPTETPNTNNSYQVRTTLNYAPTLTATNNTLNISNYTNGADELMEHVTSSYTSGEPDEGRFAVYRTAWKDNTGYILRNDGVGSFFRIKSFYKTDGVTSDPFISLKKMPDMPGSTKVEGELVDLDNGVFFFNNSGSIAAFNDTTGTWETGGSSTIAFRSVQDTTVESFDSNENTLKVTSDHDKNAYLSFDYSTSAFIKFNGQDLTFSNLGIRPSGEQWITGIY